MGDLSRRPRAAERMRVLTRAYRAIAERYADVESLSRRQRELLASAPAIREVHELLEQKRVVLSEIRRVEEKAAFEGGRGWPGADGAPAAARELLAVLEEVSRRIHRSIALEAECRTLLEPSSPRRGNASPPKSRERSRSLGSAR